MATPPTTTKGVGSWLKGHRAETLLGAGGIVVSIALYVRSKNSAASNTASTTEPQSTADTTDSDLYNDLEGQIEQLGNAVNNSLAATGGVNPGGPVDNLTGNPTVPSSPSTPSIPSSSPSSLPWVGPGSIPDNVTTAMVDEYGPFEQIGYDTNGKYSGEQVAGGVPTFAQFGTGYFQNYGLAGGPSPNYTGPVFIPEDDQEYVNYNGPITGQP